MAGSWVGVETWDGGGGQDPLPRGRRSVVVISCRECDSTDVFRRDGQETFAFWQCRTCNARWKELHDTGSNGRAYIA